MLALGVAGFATTAALRGYLLDRVDNQLRAASRPVVEGAHRPVPGLPDPDPDHDGRPPSEYYVSFADAADR
jgi:hypothetical protein